MKKLLFLLLVPFVSIAQSPVFGVSSWTARQPISLEMPQRFAAKVPKLPVSASLSALEVLPENYNWRRDAFQTETLRRAAYGLHPFYSGERELPFDVMKEVNFRALYSRRP
ncbi:MAG: hypothetical protein EOO51_03220 [Flavobacterium sp.]|nr:MAG: hypothetical protein EOO51_03220 [Flavobacterium sp.]